VLFCVPVGVIGGQKIVLGFQLSIGCVFGGVGVRVLWYVKKIFAFCNDTVESFIRWTFNFVLLLFCVGKAIHNFKIPTKYLFTSYIVHNLKFMNAIVHLGHCRQTNKFPAHEIK